MNPAVEQLRAAVDRLMREGRSEGIEPDGPLGVWLEAQAEALQGFAAVLDGQEARFEQALAKVDAANKSELEKLAAAVTLARETVQQGELALLQARNAQVLHVVETQNAEQRMIKDTLPKFIQALKGALIIRETRWNRRKESVRFSLAGLFLVGVFVAGFATCFWRDQDQVAAINRCLAAAIPSNGHLYCQLDAVLPQAAAPARAQ